MLQKQDQHHIPTVKHLLQYSNFLGKDLSYRDLNLQRQPRDTSNKEDKENKDFLFKTHYQQASTVVPPEVQLPVQTLRKP